jgi:hypothetical protein
MPCCANEDNCDCTGCRYPNGPLKVILAQCLMLLGAIFSIEAMVDCRVFDSDSGNALMSIAIPVATDD